MHTIGEAAALLGIGRVTLEKWCKRLGIEPARHPQDWRFRTLTPEQVQQIADERAKMPGNPPVIPSSSPLAFRRRQSEEGGYLDTSPAQSAMPRQRQQRTRAPKAGGEDLPPLPAGHVSRQHVGPDHGIPAATVLSWCNAGKIETLAGEYRGAVPGAFSVRNPVTLLGLAQFYQLASPRSDFVRCLACPHEDEPHEPAPGSDSE